MNNLPEAPQPNRIDRITGLLWAIAAVLNALAPLIHHAS
jgi:hypothetical protein